MNRHAVIPVSYTHLDVYKRQPRRLGAYRKNMGEIAMKKQRSLPFGYEMRKGAIAIHSKEAQIVRRIYQLYEDGGSIITLSLIHI